MGVPAGQLAIEVVEVPVPERAAAICGTALRSPRRRPAIVYATSRSRRRSWRRRFLDDVAGKRYLRG